MSYRSLVLATAIACGALTLTPLSAKEALDIEAMESALRSQDQEAVLKALKTIRKSKEPKAAPLLDSLLNRGGSAPVLKAALKAAGKLGQRSSTHAVGPYARHRMPEIRRAAVQALIRTGGPEAVQILQLALRSNDGRVRGIAATGLGSLAAHESIDDLMTAFDHGVAEAAAAIGQLCLPEECEDFAERVGQAHFDGMTGGFDQILFRPTKEMPDAQKLRIIGRVRELGTSEAAAFLGDVLERWPSDWSKKVKQALQSATKATGGS